MIASRQHRWIAALLAVGAGLGCREVGGPNPAPTTERIEVEKGHFVDALAVGQTLPVTFPGRLRGRTNEAGLALVQDGRRVALEGVVDVELDPGHWELSGSASGRLEEPRWVKPDGGRLVVLVVIDTLRDDHLDVALTPSILEALGGARRFVDTRANASWTLPSMASALTSRPVLGLTAPDGTLIGIPPDLETLAQRFRTLGYATAGFVANGTLREGNGFGTGFSRFVGTGAVEEPPTDVAVMLERAREWIAAHQGEDAFVWIHLMEPHEPLRDHAGLGRAAVEARVLASRELRPTVGQADTFRALYAGEVRYLDQWLGPFLAELPESAVIALTSDHGEMLGERESWGHGLTVYPEVLRVPLLIRAPGVEPGDEAAPAQLLDLAPTLLGAVGAELAGAAGRNLMLDRGGAAVRTAATFSAGPLRWSWRADDGEVIAHFSRQEGLAPASQVVLHEIDPLPTGWSVEGGAAPGQQELAGSLLQRVGKDFAVDVGAWVPGLQVLAGGIAAGEPLEVETRGEVRIEQVLAVSATKVDRDRSRLALTWSEDQPLVLVVLGGAPVTPAGEGWIVGREGRPPVLRLPGKALWRNPRQARVQHPQEELLAHLRALGYLR